jgi:glutamine cyclotransferase
MSRRSTATLALVVLPLFVVSCGDDEAANGDEPPPALTGTSIVVEDPEVALLGVEVVQTQPHRTDAWTEGLVWDDGRLYESAGMTGQSNIAEVDPATGEAVRVVPVDPALYAEGLALVGGEFIQLTWQDGVALRRDKATFEETGRFSYDGEGWGLCFDGDRLVMSDGSPTLTFRDPETFEATGTVDVTLEGEPVDELNELECVDDRVYANVWHTDMITEIDPSSGEVTAVIDASEVRAHLDPAPTSGENVLNGIAYKPDTDTFWLTGKLWPQMFEVRFVDPETAGSTTTS